MVPLLENLLEYARARDEKRVIAYRATAVSPTCKWTFNGAPLVDVRDESKDGPTSLRTLVEGAINGCGNALMFADDPESAADAFRLGIAGASSCIDRMKKIVVAYEPATAQV